MDPQPSTFHKTPATLKLKENAVQLIQFTLSDQSLISLQEKTEGEYGILTVTTSKITMPRPYSKDLRCWAIWLKEILGLQVDDQVDEVAAALRKSRTLEAFIRQRKLK